MLYSADRILFSELISIDFVLPGCLHLPSIRSLSIPFTYRQKTNKSLYFDCLLLQISICSHLSLCSLYHQLHSHTTETLKSAKLHRHFPPSLHASSSQALLNIYMTFSIPSLLFLQLITHPISRGLDKICDSCMLSALEGFGNYHIVDKYYR